MPSSPSSRISTFSRLPLLQAAKPAKKEKYTAVYSGVEAIPCSVPRREELPAATLACLEVLEQILQEASPAPLCASADVAHEHPDGEHSGNHPYGHGDETLDSKSRTAEHTAGNTADDLLRTSSSGTLSRSSEDADVAHTERLSAAAAAGNGSFSVERGDNEECATNRGNTDPRKVGRGTIVKSYASAFRLLRAAGVLDTLPKCVHMLHAVCILADRQRQIDYRAAATVARDEGSLAGAFSTSPKRRRKLAGDRQAVVGSAESAVRIPECGNDVSTRWDANVDSRKAGGQEEGNKLLVKTRASSPEHKTDVERALCSDAEGKISSGEAQIESLVTDCVSLGMCRVGDAPIQKLFSVRGQDTMDAQLHRRNRIAHIAGLLLGSLEALGAPPPLNDPKFDEKVLNVVSRLFYTRFPMEEKNSTTCDASTMTLSMRDSEGTSDASNKLNGLNSKKSNSISGGVTSIFLDTPSDGQRLDCRTMSYEGLMPFMPYDPHVWRQQIIDRFDTVERLLFSSVPSVFLGAEVPTETTQENSLSSAGTAAAASGGTPGNGREGVIGEDPESIRDFASNSEHIGTCTGDSCVPTEIADGQGSTDTSVTGDLRSFKGNAAKNGSSVAALVVQGRERCRRALRMVRRWVAFLLELEEERQALIKRILLASEEVQGLPHMLMQEGREAVEVQQGQQVNVSSAEPTSSSTSTTKKRTLLMFRSPREGEVTQEPHKDDLEKTVTGTDGCGRQTEELEARIRATQQVLLLPSIPPFTRPERETVHNARTRFERCLQRWKEAQDRRLQEAEEARKKAAAAAAAVRYVTDRMQEQQQAQAAAFSSPPGTAAAATALLRLRSISHAFYLLGLNPQTATVQMVEQVRKKWRVLLHPDKFVSVHPHLLPQATEAFKAFHVAATEASRILSQRRVEPSWSPPPPPPDLASGPSCVAAPARGVTALVQPASSGSEQGLGKGAAAGATAGAPCEGKPRPDTYKACCPAPTHRFSPEVTVQVSRSKKKAHTGRLVLHVHAPPSKEGDWPFAVIKEIRVFVLRPTVSEESLWKLLPTRADVCLFMTKSVELKCVTSTATGKLRPSPETADKNITDPTNKVEISALQPIELGVEKVYWVGVQVEGLHKAQSLITWKPVTVCLALPQGADDTAPSRLSDSGSGSPATGEDAAASEASSGSTGFSAVNRALLSFLQTFTAAFFVQDDTTFSARLRDAIASLKRVLRQQKKSVTSGLVGKCRQYTEDWKWVEDEARQVLQECMVRARSWKSEEDEKTSSSTTD